MILSDDLLMIREILQDMNDEDLEQLAHVWSNNTATGYLLVIAEKQKRLEYDDSILSKPQT